MFRPDTNHDRTDYNSMLLPPEGYRLEKAVGTTYSLDFEILTAVSICLGLSEDADSKLMQNPMSRLYALQKVADKIVVFCEAGQIKVPSKPTALFSLFEKMVVPVALPKDRKSGRYPAFHPKTWILSYVNDAGDKRYRFVVMSRNLTNDRSWDISFAMDSSRQVRQKKKTKPIIHFLGYLVGCVHNTSQDAGKKRKLLRNMIEELSNVSFSLDSIEFGEDYEILPLGIGENAYSMADDILFCKKDSADSTFHELVVMSPFLSESVIADFNKMERGLNGCKRTLITRRSELSKLKNSDIDNFTIYALKDEVIDGENAISDETDEKMKQDIHAKIYIRRKYSDVNLYLGSMNASQSAINKNVEMMLRLGTKSRHLNGQSFLDDIFCGPEDDEKNPFEKVTIKDVIADSESDNNNLLELKIKELCRAKKRAYIEDNNGKYKIVIELAEIQNDEGIFLSPFHSKQQQILSERMEFVDLDILQLSEFYEVIAKAGEDEIRRIIMIPTTGFPEERESAVVSSVIKYRTSFIEYIAFVLGDDYLTSMLEEKQIRESGFFKNTHDAMPALYEKMLRISLEEPERLRDIEYVLRMVTDKDIIPDEFRTLYETFGRTLKIK